jgi:hypothetical protein
VFGAHGRAIEREAAAPLQDPIDDGLCEVFVVEHAAPRRECEVRREDHSALLSMPIVDDVEEHIGGVSAVREIADLVDDEYAGVNVRG